MKQTCLVILAALAIASPGSAVRVGPKNCVSLTQSTEGSCVISTNCDGVDLSSFEFAFDCMAKDGVVQRHSFGYGGFDANEEFDTSVKCAKCAADASQQPPQEEAPQKQEEAKAPQTQADVQKVAFRDSVIATSRGSAVVAAVGVSKDTVQDNDKDKDEKKDEEKDEKKKDKEDDKKEDKKEGEKKDDESDLKPPEDASKITKYGPNSCIMAWKGESTSHCIMKTACGKNDVSKYMFGLLCESKKVLTRHLFGKGSFNSEETFDTLIPCDACLALDAPPDVELSAEVKGLKDEVEEIKKGVTALEDKVGELNGEHKENEKEEKKEEEKKDDDDKKKDDDDKKKDSSFLIHSGDADSDADEVDQQVLKGSFRRTHRHVRHHKRRRVRQDDEDDDSETDGEEEEEAPRPVKRHRKLARRAAKSKEADDSDDQGRDEDEDSESDDLDSDN